MDYKDLTETLPFITVLKHHDIEYTCIFQNHDEKIVSFYDISLIKSADDKRALMQLADIWWYESNRKLPISIFLYEQMKSFKKYIRTVPMKDTEILIGPTVSLNALVQKRIKRREIKLIRKVD
jgi:hypothetical protein